jgi:hypothetical protein
LEAFAAGLPVVGFRPIPGHGRAGVLALAEAGLVTYAPDESALVVAVDKMRRPGADRDAQCTRASAIFAGEPAGAIREWLGDSPKTADAEEEPSVQRD